MSKSREKAFSSLAVGILVIAIFVSSAGATCQGTTVITVPSGYTGAQIQNLLDAHQASGTVFCFAAGTYSITTPIVPYNGQILMGDPAGFASGGAILDGSVAITATWLTDTYGNYMTSVGANIIPHVIPIPSPNAPCQITTDTACEYSDSIYVSNPNPATHVCPGQTSDGSTPDGNSLDSYYEYCMPRRVLFFSQGPGSGQIVAPTSTMTSGTYTIVYSTTSDATIYLADNPSGEMVSLAKAPSIINYCLPDYSRCVDSSVNSQGVTIQGLVIQKAANQGQVGAIHAPGTYRWTIKGNILRYNHAVGVIADRETVGGTTGHNVLGNYNFPDLSLAGLNDTNYFHHNGQIGLEGSCIPKGKSDPLMPSPTTCVPYGWDTHEIENPSAHILHNRFDHNNSLYFSAQFGAGAAKFAGTYYMVFDHNEAFRNVGPAYWWDINCKGMTITNNVAQFNVMDKSSRGAGDGLASGVIIEVSTTATIQGNDLEYNDLTVSLDNMGNDNNQAFINTGQIIIAESPKITVGGNGTGLGNTLKGIQGVGFRMSSSTVNQVTGVGSGRTDWCGGYATGTPSDNSPTMYTDWPSDTDTSQPYCPINNSSGQSMHDIRSQDDHLNHSRVQYNDITETETNDPNITGDGSYNGEIAGYDTDMGPTGTPNGTTFYPSSADCDATGCVFDHNTYHLFPGNTNEFTPNGGHQGIPLGRPLLNFSDWKTASGQDAHSTAN